MKLLAQIAVFPMVLMASTCIQAKRVIKAEVVHPDSKSQHKASKTQSKLALGGGPGMVWVSTGSKIYHCQHDRWYGRTRHGRYLREDDARAKGYHAAHGKACAG